MKITFENLRNVCKFHQNDRQGNWCNAEGHKCSPELCPYATLDVPQDNKTSQLSETLEKLRNKIESINNNVPGQIDFINIDEFGFYTYRIHLHEDRSIKFKLSPEQADQYRICIDDMCKREDKKTVKTVSAASKDWNGSPISSIDKALETGETILNV